MIILSIILSVIYVILLYYLGYRWTKPAGSLSFILLVLAILIGVSIYFSKYNLWVAVVGPIILWYVTNSAAVNKAYDIARHESLTSASNSRTESEKNYHYRWSIATDAEYRKRVLEKLNRKW